METRTKLLAVGLIALIICQSCATLGILGIQRAYAEAAPGIYTATNVIYINATGLGKAGSEIKRLEITETAKDALPIKGIADRPFAENVSVQFDALQSLYQHQTGDTIELFGITVNATGVQRIIGNIFKDAIIPVNMTDWYAMGATQPALAYPTTTKTLFFKAPFDYAEDYCTAHGYVMHNIVNSTYEQTYDMNTLNFYQTQLLKNEMMIINYTRANDTMSALKQYGGALIKSPATVALAIGVCVAIIIIFMCLTIIPQWISDYWDNVGFNDDLNAKYKALALGINATTYLAALAQTNKAGARTQAMEMYNNNTISWEQLQYLLNQIDVSYNPGINNATVDIAQLIRDYYNATSIDFQKYLDAIAFNSSWTSWLWDIIYLIAAIVVAYIVIVLVGKFKSTKAPSQSVIIPYRM